MQMPHNMIRLFHKLTTYFAAVKKICPKLFPSMLSSDTFHTAFKYGRQNKMKIKRNCILVVPKSAATTFNRSTTNNTSNMHTKLQSNQSVSCGDKQHILHWLLLFVLQFNGIDDESTRKHVQLGDARALRLNKLQYSAEIIEFFFCFPNEKGIREDE